MITPGTEFMHRLAKAIREEYLSARMNTPEFDGLCLVFSDAFVPGEGEHKILDFIRSQRNQPDYDPNQSHCIYGADADLIMLGLSTHEPNFYILREAVQAQPANKDKACFKCGQKGHMSYDCGKPEKPVKIVEFQFVKISVLREYLQLEFKDCQPTKFQFDFERIVDDFVFLCFLVGNDFLPHLPSLQIREGALDAILVIYKNLLPRMTDYLANEGQLSLENADLLFKDISKLEEEQFKLQLAKQQRENQYHHNRRQHV